MTPSTPKTYLLFAKDAPVGVVFYRKSRLTTYCLHYDYESKGNGFRCKLTRGSRFYGRIFPERCDLSPDGALMVYFAMRGMKTAGSADPSTWSAVCTPPWLKAHLFFPNNSTWGGGGVFLRDRRLVVFDSPPKAAGPEYSRFRGYEIVRDTKALPVSEIDILKRRFQPPAVIKTPCPVGAGRKPRPVLVKTLKPDHLGDYDRFDYVLQDTSGNDVEGVEEIVLANWAGWDNFGRLVVVAGRCLKIYDVEAGRRLEKPVKVLDLEDVLP